MHVRAFLWSKEVGSRTALETSEQHSQQKYVPSQNKHPQLRQAVKLINCYGVQLSEQTMSTNIQQRHKLQSIAIEWIGHANYLIVFGCEHLSL